MSIESMLSKYPGRGLIHLVDTTGIASWAYFITGRSESSRARRITAEHGGLDVTATSESAGFDALRHYTCARPTNDGLIVGNGDHVDAIAIGLDEPRPLVEVLDDVEPEPDPPIRTPRIALVLDAEPKMSAVSRSNGEVIRKVHSCAQRTGTASVITTYSGSVHTPIGNAPYFETDETRSLQELWEALFWDHLEHQLRVLLVARPAPTSPGTTSVTTSIMLG